MAGVYANMLTEETKCIWKQSNKVVNKLKIGDRFGNWTIIDKADDRIDSCGKHHTRFKCQCDCGTILDKDAYKLKNGAKMCKSCYLKIAHQNSIPFQHFTNEIIKRKGYAILIAHNTNNEVLIDLDDCQKIQDICWWENSLGYIRGYDTTSKSVVFLHRIIMNVDDEHIVDHINRNPKDCRKSNLRICSQKDNVKNKGLYKNNTSGKSGVCFDKKSGKWLAYIGNNKEVIRLGYFENKELAIQTRLAAEPKYFGEFAPKLETA